MVAVVSRGSCFYFTAHTMIYVDVHVQKNMSHGKISCIITGNKARLEQSLLIDLLLSSCVPY